MGLVHILERSVKRESTKRDNEDASEAPQECPAPCARAATGSRVAECSP